MQNSVVIKTKKNIKTAKDLKKIDNYKVNYDISGQEISAGNDIRLVNTDNFIVRAIPVEAKAGYKYTGNSIEANAGASYSTLKFTASGEFIKNSNTSINSSLYYADVHANAKMDKHGVKASAGAIAAFNKNTVIHRQRVFNTVIVTEFTGYVGAIGGEIEGEISDKRIGGKVGLADGNGGAVKVYIEKVDD